MRLLAAFLLLTAALSAQVADQAEPRPNILLILGDNWSWPHAGAYGDRNARTPAFDRLAREGVLFDHAFNPAPSCSPCRASILTGRPIHMLGERASLWSGFPKDTPVFTQLLRTAGYAIGYSGKPWAPGDAKVSGWEENPVGPKFGSFEEFLGKTPGRQPFFFWLGNTDTATRAGKHPFLAQAQAAGLKAADMVVPAGLPDCEATRLDMLNYYGGVLSLDREIDRAYVALKAAGLLEKTLIICCSDNGWQLPRGLGNCYDRGSRVPFVVRWPAESLSRWRPAQTGLRSDAFISLGSLATTFLRCAGLEPPAEMSWMRGEIGTLAGRPRPTFDSAPAFREEDAVYIERERHADVRAGHLSYPMRAVRDKDWLYVRNLRPDRWPAGDPDVLFLHGRPFGDVDTTATKDFLLAHRDDALGRPYFDLIFGKRPAEELYDLKEDPEQLRNVAEDPAPRRREALLRLRANLDRWMRQTHDPRADPKYDKWDEYPYYGKAPK